MKVGLTLPSPATVGVAYSGSVTCENISGFAALDATCAVSGLPAGLSVGTCSPSTPVGSLGAGSVISCPISGTPSTAGTSAVTGTTSATNDTAPANNTVTASLTVINSGKVTLVVNADDGGPFAFSSGGAFNVTVTTPAGGGTAQSSPITLVAGSYPVSISTPKGFGLTSITCSDAPSSSGNPAAKTLTVNLSAGENVTCTVTATNSAKRTTGIIGKFMGKRADYILSGGPDARRQIDRLEEAEAVSKGGQVGGSDKTASMAPTAPKVAGSKGNFESKLADLKGETGGASAPAGAEADGAGSSSFSFSTSLSKAMSLGAKTRPDGTPMPAPPTKSLFDIWTEVRYTSFGDARTGVDGSGTLLMAYIGADYIVSRNLLVGILAQFDDMDETGKGYRVGGKGWMAGPYATLKLNQNLYLQTRYAWGQSSNYVSPYNTYFDSFDTTRWLATAALVGHYTYGKWDFRPMVSVAKMEDVSGAYIDSLGVAIPSVKVGIGQFKAGPEVSYKHVLPSGTVIEPRFGAHVIWNFEGSDLPIDLGGTLTGPEGVRGRIELGLNMRMFDGVMIDLGVAYDGIGTAGDFNAVTGKANVRVPLN
jgi:outer membrane autotransporter protein